jgi:uncharacterized protein (DUF1501 family)
MSELIPFSRGVSRRRFLQGTAAAAGAAAILPSWLADAAGAAPLGSSEGMVVLVTLAGGNDYLNTVVPRSGTRRSQYEKLRGQLAIPASSLGALDADNGLHPSLPKLSARFGTGRVAVVQGIGVDLNDLSHFSSMATVSAGTASSSRTSGWLGRYLDGTSTWDNLLGGIAVEPMVPLSLVGKRAKVCAAPGGAAAAVSSANLTAPADALVLQAVRGFQGTGGATGLGQWGDALAAMNTCGFEQAVPINALRSPALPSTPFSRDLTLAARALNADFGTRVVTVSSTGFDTHAMQLDAHASMLQQLDDGIEAFWSTLSSTLRSRVTMVVVSEFGRRAAANGSLGTDHGRAGAALVIGENVRGGMLGQAPALDKLDANGDLVPTVDFRSLYATVLDRWLGADSREVLGATYPQLELFAGAPGARRAAA